MDHELPAAELALEAAELDQPAAEAHTLAEWMLQTVANAAAAAAVLCPGVAPGCSTAS